jgi:hypothetical protein
MPHQALRELSRRAAILILLFTLVFSASCRGRRRTADNQSPCAGALAEIAPVSINQPVNYCVNRPIEPRRGNVQILIDSSGSMIGFQKAAPQLVNWAQHSFSLLNTSTLQIQSSRVCQFSQSLPGGVANCASGQGFDSYKPAGNTNIHQAIHAARDSDLTLILTDGIAASGKEGSGDCARGVDIACVAHAMRDAMRATAADGVTGDWGLWFMPLIAEYDGPFYTEEPMPADFQERKVVEQIRADLGAQVEVTNPRSGAGGLVYQYRGPRALLLIVIARWADVGRATLQALWGRAQDRGLNRINKVREFSAGIACLQPVEVYPGFLNVVQWKNLVEPDAPGERSGTIDVSFATENNKAAIQVRCPENGAGAGVFTLNGQANDAGSVAGCVPINMLPGAAFQMRAAGSDDEAALQQILRGAERRSETSEQLRLCLACDMTNPRYCDNPARAQWVAVMNYKHAAEGLATDKADNIVYQQIRGLSTAHPSLEPHRIYAFSATLGAFYQDVGADQRIFVLSQLDFCHKR